MNPTSEPPTSAAFFEARYRGNPDPWNFAADSYENARYRAILRAIEGLRVNRVFEPGCSVGVLTQMLAGVAEQVVACDFSESAVAAARERCRDLCNTSITCRALGPEEPWSEFDLVVLSEIGYYFTAAAWAELVSRMCDQAPIGACVMACHWLGHSADHAQHGDAVHNTLAAHAGLQYLRGERYTDPAGDKCGFRLDLWRKL